MKRFALLVFVFLIATPIFAADRLFDITGWASWVDPQSNGTFNSSNPNQPFDISFNGKLGYGAGVNVFFGKTLSLALDAVEVQPEARFGFPGAVTNSGAIKMIPITGVLQWHFIPSGFIDPYIGAGAAYVLFDNLQELPRRRAPRREPDQLQGRRRVRRQCRPGLQLLAALGDHRRREIRSGEVIRHRGLRDRTESIAEGEDQSGDFLRRD